jgi:Lon protease-like protein
MKFLSQLADMPGEIPIFPLPSALLLPGGQLPLNIFEPRYLAMIDAALATPDRLIGMVQPLTDEGDLFGVGCAGRISYFQETDDGQMMIALTGMCRFKLLSHHESAAGFRLASVNWQEFEGDLDRIDAPIDDREQLLDVMRQYFKVRGFEADWDQIEQSENEQILNTLAMVCPFDVAEKQALLEANDASQRAALLVAMMEMALHEEDSGNDARH